MLSRIPCVGAIVVDRDRLLLVRRGTEPALGRWSVPGGRVEPGESDAAAVAREVLEETGLEVTVGPLVGYVERDAPGGGVYLIRDYECRPAAGSDVEAVSAATDAADARWVAVADVGDMDCAPGLVEALTQWGVLGP